MEHWTTGGGGGRWIDEEENKKAIQNTYIISVRIIANWNRGKNTTQFAMYVFVYIF